MENVDYTAKVRHEVWLIRKGFVEFKRFRHIKEHAEMNGLNAEQFSRWDNGRVTPSLGEFMKWRKAACLFNGRKCLTIASKAQKLDLKTYLMMCDILEVNYWD